MMLIVGQSLARRTRGKMTFDAGSIFRRQCVVGIGRQ
jgi:hypothetical protein